jgi:hypothetical protein
MSDTAMPERDTNREALEQVEKATESDPIKGEDLLESENLKRQLREAKERLSEATSTTDGREDRKS